MRSRYLPGLKWNAPETSLVLSLESCVVSLWIGARLEEVGRRQAGWNLRVTAQSQSFSWSLEMGEALVTCSHCHEALHAFSVGMKLKEIFLELLRLGNWSQRQERTDIPVAVKGGPCSSFPSLSSSFRIVPFPFLPVIPETVSSHLKLLSRVFTTEKLH